MIYLNKKKLLLFLILNCVLYIKIINNASTLKTTSDEINMIDTNNFNFNKINDINIFLRDKSKIVGDNSFIIPFQSVYETMNFNNNKKASQNHKYFNYFKDKIRIYSFIYEQAYSFTDLDLNSNNNEIVGVTYLFTNISKESIINNGLYIGISFGSPTMINGDYLIIIYKNNDNWDVIDAVYNSKGKYNTHSIIKRSKQDSLSLKESMIWINDISNLNIKDDQMNNIKYNEIFAFKWKKIFFEESSKNIWKHYNSWKDLYLSRFNSDIKVDKNNYYINFSLGNLKKDLINSATLPSNNQDLFIDYHYIRSKKYLLFVDHMESIDMLLFSLKYTSNPEKNQVYNLFNNQNVIKYKPYISNNEYLIYSMSDNWDLPFYDITTFANYYYSLLNNSNNINELYIIPIIDINDNNSLTALFKIYSNHIDIYLYSLTRNSYDKTKPYGMYKALNFTYINLDDKNKNSASKSLFIIIQFNPDNNFNMFEIKNNYYSPEENSYVKIDEKEDVNNDSSVKNNKIVELIDSAWIDLNNNKQLWGPYKSMWISYFKIHTNNNIEDTEHIDYNLFNKNINNNYANIYLSATIGINTNEFEPNFYKNKQTGEIISLQNNYIYDFKNNILIKDQYKSTRLDYYNKLIMMIDNDSSFNYIKYNLIPTIFVIINYLVM